VEAVGEGPAHVFGSSGGAVTGLALVGHYPGHVQTLIAHEPPLALLLPQAEEARAGMHEIYDTYRDRGISAAWERFSSFTGMNIRPQGDSAGPQPPSAEAVAMSERFFGHGLVPIALYQPDFPALQAAPSRVIVAGGTTSKGEFAQRTAVALAERLGTPLIDFPGGHGGFASDAADSPTSCATYWRSSPDAAHPETVPAPGDLGDRGGGMLASRKRHTGQGHLGQSSRRGLVTGVFCAAASHHCPSRSTSTYSAICENLSCLAPALVVLAIVSTFTGFKVKFLPFRLCPAIFTGSATLILAGTFT
jgi:hypothetical protein